MPSHPIGIQKALKISAKYTEHYEKNFVKDKTYMFEKLFGLECEGEEIQEEKDLKFLKSACSQIWLCFVSLVPLR